MMRVLFSVEVLADAEHSDYAGSDEQSIKDTVKYGMIPIGAETIADGTYDIDVISSSSFFKVNKARLYVKKGKMKADLILSSHSYVLLYPGSGKEAAKAPASDYISYVEDPDGNYVFTIPVSNLNEGVPCAAYSKNREKWYDRVLVFDAGSLPKGTLPYELPDYDLIDKAVKSYELDQRKKIADKKNGSTDAGSGDADTPEEAMKMNRPDGEYSIEVNMTGGSGRASISSPTLLIVKKGRAYAQLIWSSSYYDYVIVGGKKFLNETKDGGNSVFTIPVTRMDRIIPIKADTTAMGDPVEVDYSLTFYENTIGDKGLIPQEAAKKVLIFALIIIVVGGILNHIVKTRRKGR